MSDRRTSTRPAGAKASRSGRGSRARGEQTRAKILEGVVRVIARDGVGGVTHRAVAAESNVNLSLTTYYFVDRYDLVASAFEVFVVQGRVELDRHWARAFEHIAAILAKGRSKAARVRLRDYVADQIVRYVRGKLADAPLGVALEQHIFTEALVDERLTELGAAHRAHLLEPMRKLCELGGSDQPAVDADLLLGTILRLEYESLLLPAGKPDARRMRASLGRLLGFIFAVDRDRR